MALIQILDKKFEISIPEKDIATRVLEMADNINNDLKDKDVLFVAVLNGSFMFASDLYKRINLSSEISFVKVASYQGTESSGKVKELIGFNENLSGKTVVIIEDIVDTGHTLDFLCNKINDLKPEAIKVVTFLYKPDAHKGKKIPDYIGMSIPNDFVVGYGLDYDGKGRNLPDIYTLHTNKEPTCNL